MRTAQVELDRRAGDETPRVTIKRFQPLSDLAKRTRLQMTVRRADGSMAERVARELADARGGNGSCASSCRWRQAARRSSSPAATSRSTRELAARIERITGEGSVDLSVQEPPKLALVG